MFNTYNPMQYLAIDIANQYGKDKDTYEDRIDFVKTNYDDLESLVSEAEEPLLYAKAVRALRDAQAGKEIGHTVALDSVCSGMQIMSAMMGCRAGCSITGLIYENVRSDAYTEITSEMNRLLPAFIEANPTLKDTNDISVSRKDAKDAVMKGLYGSKKVPKEIFGEDLLPLFFQAVNVQCPGAYQLLELLRDAWNPEADINTWELPDSHMAVVPVTEVIEKRINISELNYTPVVLVEVIKPQDYGISLIANGVHSVDAYVLRSLVRRCSYDERILREAKKLLNMVGYKPSSCFCKAVSRWNDTGIADLSVLDFLDRFTASEYPPEMRKELIRLIDMSLEHKPFDIVCVHDSFAVHPNNCNQLRKVYADILACIADSTLVDDLLNQLYSTVDTVDKLSDTKALAKEIRESNYGIC